MDLNQAEDNEEAPKTLECIFCKARLFFWAKESVPKKYHSHLRNQHEIIYQIDVVVQATFEQQYPELSNQKKSCKCEEEKTSEDIYSTPKQNGEVQDEDYDSELEILSDSETVFNKPVNGTSSVPSQKPGPKSRKRNLSASSDDSSALLNNRNEKTNMIEIKDKYGKSVFLKKFPGDSSNEALEKQARVRSMSSSSEDGNMPVEKMIPPASIKQEQFNKSYESVEVQPDIGASSAIAEIGGPITVNWHSGTLHGCKLCPRQFLEVGDFKQHISSDHPETSLEQMTEENGGDLMVVKNFYE